MQRLALTVTLLVSLLVGSVSIFITSQVKAAAPPYPPSQVVTGLVWDTTVTRVGDGVTGDNWPVTWADDDLLYGAYGDGDSFNNRSPKLSLGFATLGGQPPNLSPRDFSSNIDTPEGQGPNGIKASGILMVDGALYLFVRNYRPSGSSDYTNSQLAWSSDHGRMWIWASWYFADTFGAPEFVQFGKNYAGARDNYVYVVSQSNDSAYGWTPDVVMARVPKDRVADRAAYTFFAGLDGSSGPQWSSDINQRRPIFTDPNGTQRIGLTYNAALRRYFLTSAHQTGGGATHTPALGVFDAPEPWGPWSAVYYNDNFSGGYAFHHKFPTKWMSADGRTMWQLYSGSNTGDSCNCITLRKATLTLNGAPPTPTATGPPAGATGLRGDYFSDPNLAHLALSRTDPTVDFNWRTGAVAPGVGPDNFSVRWTSQVTPQFGETYTFFTQSDDGVRLWINGQLVIDDWKRHGTTERSGTIALQAGQRYNLKLEYFEYNVDATVRLLWSSASQPLQIVPQSQLVPAGAAPPAPTSTLPPTAAPSPSPLPTVRPTPITAPPEGGPKLIFGLGAEADQAIDARLVREAPVRMLTSWYNDPNDLAWMTGWKTGLVPHAYASGYALHLIVFSDVPESRFTTPYGAACGRPYPLSARFLDDMRQLAQTFAGAEGGPPLYVTMFTEFQTYACTDNAWNPNAETNAYYRALKDRYLATIAVFHQYAPNAKVSLGWGGWQTHWDDPKTGAGRSMFQYFDDVMCASDFQSFQAMQNDGNVDDVRAMVRTLGAYCPVMLAHYKPDNGSAATFERDLRAMLTDAYLSEVTSAGLFAWSFMDNQNLSASESVYQLTKDAVGRYGADPH